MPAGAKNAHQNTPTFVKKAVLRPCDRFLEPVGRRMSFFQAREAETRLFFNILLTLYAAR